MKSLYWLIRREFWEHRGGFLWAPVVTGGAFLLLNLLAVVAAQATGRFQHIGGSIEIDGHSTSYLLSNIDGDQTTKIGEGLDIAMYSASALMAVVLGFVVLFYCLGALYDDRRDRSILFWKSLPVSDTATVLSKVLSATVLAPLITVVSGVVTGALMLLLYTIALSFHVPGIWRLLAFAHPLQVMLNLFASIPLYFLWALPTVGWLLLCSAWARSKPFLWALLLPVAIGIAIDWFSLTGMIALDWKWFWTHVFNRLVLGVFPGQWLGSTTDIGDMGGHLAGTARGVSSFDLDHGYTALASLNLWIGAAAGAVMIGAAIWFRRWRDDS